MPDPSLSPPVAKFLLDQVNSLTLSVGAADFEEALAIVLAARQELGAIVGAAESQSTPKPE